MENASKALLIAGAMLLTILITTFAIFIFRGFGEQTSRLYGRLEQPDVDSFNQKFFQYEDKNLKIQDVISIINLAKNNNTNREMPVTVKVIFSGKDYANESNQNLNQLLYDKKDSDQEYKCTVEIPSGSILVEKVTITQL